MDKKVMLQGLAEGLARRQGLTLPEADLFVRSVFEIITEYLKTQKQVKIKGLGTFKLVEVESRESVDVNTGERIVINGYTKISFTPETGLKDEINKPFSHFNTVVLNDETLTEDMERVEEDKVSLEDEDLEQDVAQLDIEERNTEVVADVPVAPETDDVKSENNNISEDNNDSSSVSQLLEGLKDTLDEIQNEKNPVTDKVEEKENIFNEPQVEHLHAEYQHIECQNVTEGHIEHQRTHSQDVKEQKVEVLNVEHQTVENQHIVQMIPENTLSKRNAHSPIMIILLTVLIVILLIISYLAGYYRVFEFNDKYFKNENTEPVIIKVDSLEKADSLRGVPAPKPLIKNDTIKLSVVDNKQINDTLDKKVEPKKIENKKNVQNYPQLQGGKYEIIGTKRNYKIRSGESLRLISARFYGSKDYVKYIVIYNNIKNPDIVAEGMILKLPELRLKDN